MTSVTDAVLFILANAAGSGFLRCAYIREKDQQSEAISARLAETSQLLVLLAGLQRKRLLPSGV